jgi:esterase/lipase
MDLKQIIIPIIFTYVLFGLFIYFNQTNMLFYPNSQDFNNCKNLEYTQKITKNNTRLYFYQDKTNTNDLVIYYHGNAGSACDRFELANSLKNSNISFLFVEYSGYSKDTNSINQNNLEQNIIDTIEFTKTKNYKNIILGGTSLGSGFVSKHATLQTPHKIFLISPFDSLQNLAQSKYRIYPANLMLNFEFNNIKNLKNYKNEIIIYHGDNDKIIPKKFSKNLYNKLETENKQYKLIENKGHNNLHSDNLYDEIITFIQK